MASLTTNRRKSKDTNKNDCVRYFSIKYSE